MKLELFDLTFKIFEHLFPNFATLLLLHLFPQTSSVQVHQLSPFTSLHSNALSLKWRSDPFSQICMTH